MVLISTVSAFFLSSLSSSFSRLNLVHVGPARSLRLCSLPCEQPQRHSKSCEKANTQLLRAAAGSNVLLRVARGGERSPGIAQDAAEERYEGATLPSPPFPSSCAPATTDGQGVSGRDLMIPQHSGRIERPAARGGAGEGGGGVLEQRSGGDEGEKQIGR